MSERAIPRGPDPPSASFVLAVVLELCMVATFIANKSVTGLILAGCYAYYSATWALINR